MTTIAAKPSPGKFARVPGIVDFQLVDVARSDPSAIAARRRKMTTKSQAREVVHKQSKLVKQVQEDLAL